MVFRLIILAQLPDQIQKISQLMVFVVANEIVEAEGRGKWISCIPPLSALQEGDRMSPSGLIAHCQGAVIIPMIFFLPIFFGLFFPFLAGKEKNIADRQQRIHKQGLGKAPPGQQTTKGSGGH